MLRTELLKACKVGTTWYAAVKVTNFDETPDEDGSITFAAVFLTRHDDGCWGYKNMEESAGPAVSRAPIGILTFGGSDASGA